MNKFIINDKALVVKNVLIEDNIILASDENYKTKEVFLEKVNSSKKSILDTHIKINTSDLIKIIHTKTDCAIQLFFKTNNKTSKTYIELNSEEEYSEVLEYLISKTDFELKEEFKSSFSSWFKKAAYSLISLIIFCITYFMAKDLENGSSVDISGGKKGLKRMMLFIAETLGSLNTLIIGIIVVSGFCFWTYKAYVKGKTTVEIYA